MYGVAILVQVIDIKTLWSFISCYIFLYKLRTCQYTMHRYVWIQNDDSLEPYTADYHEVQLIRVYIQSRL